MTNTPPLHVLIVLQYPGYLRYFDSVIHELGRRGHRVSVSFDKLTKQREGLVGLEGHGNRVERVGSVPERGGAFGLLARELRTTIDYLRYKHPDFRRSPYLHDRMLDALSPPLRILRWLPTLSTRTLSRVIGSLLYLEHRIPSSSRIREQLRTLRPDVVLVSPLVTKGSPQVDLVKAARSTGIPCALAVASWDHLTTKGLVRVAPDRLFVWNELQRAEAVKYHGIDPGRVTVTGAQNFDKWFRWGASTSAGAFRSKVGLATPKRYLLFVGSTASISAPAAEVEWVRRWLDRLRRSSGALKNIPVLVRPHPYNLGHWESVDLSEFGDVAVYPRFRANPVAADDRQDYFDSIYHSAAVIGVNTSAMIEAAILEKPVHTLRTDDFARTQEGTLHFRYMLPENGGFLEVAHDLDDHVDRLERSLESPEATRAVTRRFVRHFLRPLGPERESTSIFVTRLERLAASEPIPTREPTLLHPITAGLALAGKLSNGLRRLRHWRRARTEPATSSSGS